MMIRFVRPGDVKGQDTTGIVLGWSGTTLNTMTDYRPAWHGFSSQYNPQLWKHNMIVFVAIMRFVENSTSNINANDDVVLMAA